MIAYHAFDRNKLIYLSGALHIVAWFTLLAYKKRTVNLYALGTLLLYAFWLSLQKLIIYPSEKFLFTRDAIIIASPLLICLTKMSFRPFHVHILFLAVFLSFLLWNNFEIEFTTINSLIHANYNSLQEYHYGVIIGLIGLYYQKTRRYTMFLLVLGLAALAQKRVIFFGMGIAIGINIVYYLIDLWPLPYIRKAYLVIVFAVFAAIGLHLETVTEQSLKFMGYGEEVKPDNFLMGRITLFKTLKAGVFDNNNNNDLLGNGAGQADEYLRNHLSTKWTADHLAVNPHNDFLKVVFDYGYFGLAFLFLYVLTLADFSLKNRLYLFYTFPVLLVDNSLIFIFYSMILVIVARTEE
jgi:hypothetical protein